MIEEGSKMKAKKSYFFMYGMLKNPETKFVQQNNEKAIMNKMFTS